MNNQTADAWSHLLDIAADAGKYIRTTSHLKPNEAALLVAEIVRLRSLADAGGIEAPLPLGTEAGRFARAA